MTICPACGHVSSDLTLGRCTNCQMRGQAQATVTDLNQAVLDGVLHNTQLMLQRLRTGQFQQLLGVFGPREGEEHGVPFSEEECWVVYRHFKANGIPCLWVVIDDTQHSLLLAGGPTGLENGLIAARSVADQLEAELSIRAIN